MANNVLEIKDLSIHYEMREGVVKALNGVDLALKEGASHGLVGETGAGKSIIIDSINLVLGERTSRELIRTGAKSASVSALFEIGQHSKAAAMLEQEGISWQEGVLFERSVTVEGRSTAKINGKPVLASFLREVGAVLLNIHGQHDSQHLLQSERHVEFLDALAGVQPLLTQYRECYGQAVELKQKLSRMRMDEREKERRIELLSFQVSEIDEAALQPGEEEALAQKRLLMKSAQKVSESLAGALAALSPDRARSRCSGRSCTSFRRTKA